MGNLANGLGGPGTGVPLSLFVGLMVSGVSHRNGYGDIGRPRLIQDVDRGPFHVRFAMRATLWHTPFGGTVVGRALNGVTVGSWRYFKYVIHR